MEHENSLQPKEDQSWSREQDKEEEAVEMNHSGIDHSPQFPLPLHYSGRWKSVKRMSEVEPVRGGGDVEKWGVEREGEGVVLMFVLLFLTTYIYFH